MPKLSNLAEEDIVTAVVSMAKKARQHSKRWRDDAKECYDMVAGEQWEEADRERLEEQLRPIITFNRIGPVVEAVSGTEVSNRQSVVYSPREQGDAAVNELLTNAAKWVRDQCNAEDEESDMFFDLLVSGMGWTETSMDYDDDPDGMIVIDRVDPVEMLWSPNAKKRNIVDASWLQRHKKYAHDEFFDIWPDANPGGSDPLEFDDEDPAVHDATESWMYKDDQGSDLSRSERFYNVVEHQWFELETYWRVGTETRVIDVPDARFQKLRETFDERGIQYVRSQRRRYFRAFVCADTLLDLSEIPEFTYKCVTGRRDRNKNTWYGLVKAMIDPQRWANKFFSQILHIINVNAKGGLFAESDAFVDAREAERTYASPDSITMVNPGALQNGKLKEKEMAKYPSGLDRLMQFAVSSTRDVSGVNLEMLGMAERDQPGVLEHQRKQAGLTILAGMFDGLRHYRKVQGRLLLEFIRTYISDGRLIRVDGANGQQYIPLVRDDDTVKYDIIIDESPTTPNQKEQVFALFMQLMPQLSEMGIPFPQDWLDYSPFPTSMVRSWKEAMNQPPDPQQVELDMRAAEAQVAAMEAGVEKDRAKARLDQIKAMVEQQGVSFDQARLQIEGSRAETERIRVMLEQVKLSLEDEKTSTDQVIQMVATMMSANSEQQQQQGVTQ